MKPSGKIDISALSPELLQGLENAGLKPKEARVYLSLLRSGQTGASQISRDTGLHGQFVYDALGSLEEKGLAQYAIVRGRRKYSARNPRHMSQQLEERKRELDGLIKTLETRVLIDPAHQFEVFQGQSSFIANEMALLKAMPAEGTVLVIGGENDRYAEKCGSAMEELDYIRKRKNIRLRYIGAESQRAELEKRSESSLFSYRILPGNFEGSSNWGAYVELGIFGLYVFSDPVTSFIVRNEQIAHNFKTFFETLWKMAR